MDVFVFGKPFIIGSYSLQLLVVFFKAQLLTVNVMGLPRAFLVDNWIICNSQLTDRYVYNSQRKAPEKPRQPWICALFHERPRTTLKGRLRWRQFPMVNKIISRSVALNSRTECHYQDLGNPRWRFPTALLNHSFKFVRHLRWRS